MNNIKIGNVSIGSYGLYASGNYGKNAMRVDIGDLTLYFSYATVVAFHASGHAIVVSRNDWGPTTGKHLNWIDGGRSAERLSREEFEGKLQEVLREHKLV